MKILQPTEQSGIERSVRHASLIRAIALAVVVIAVIEARYWLGFGPPLLALVGLVTVLCLGNGDLSELGLRTMPVQGCRYWCRLACWFGLFLAVVLAIFAVVWHTIGWTIPIYCTPPNFEVFVHMCVMAPVSEEIIFRALLTLAILPTCGERGTIAVSGIVFAAIHVLGRNASPENQIAGFLLAWAFLKSGTIWVPIAMHSFGNFLALAGQVAGWYFIPK